jgi:hypothetical protein
MGGGGNAAFCRILLHWRWGSGTRFLGWWWGCLGLFGNTRSGGVGLRGERGGAAAAGADLLKIFHGVGLRAEVGLMVWLRARS